MARRYPSCLGLTVFVLLFATVSFGQEDTNIVQAAAADEDASWESVFVQSNRVPFYINFYVHEGLYYELVESSDYDGAFYTSIFSEKRRLTGRLGAKLHLDGALYGQSGNLPEAENSFAFRRFRVNTYGRAFFLSPVTYGLEFGLADGKFYFNDGYIWFHDVPYLASAKFGVFKAPLSMASLQSSSATPLMEVAAPVSAFAPGDMLGMQLGGAVPSRRATFFGGVFADVSDNDNQDASEGYSRLIARATCLPLGGADASSSRRLHLGVDGSYLFAKDAGVRYRARPESYLAPFLVDTGSLGGDRAAVMSGEAAWQEGALLVESELFLAYADDAADELHRFNGTYVQAGLILTGESRQYSPDAGKFTQIKPRVQFSFKDKTWGAWEWAARFSHSDLSDGAIQGGIMDVASTGLNIYLSKRNRLMFDGGFADVKDEVQSGDLWFVQSRLQIDL